MNNFNILNLGYKNLTGVVHFSFGNLTHMPSLILRGNQISGFISPVGNLFNLSYLDLSGNQINGFIPIENGNLKKLGYLDITNNLTSGKIHPNSKI